MTAGPGVWHVSRRLPHTIQTMQRVRLGVGPIAVAALAFAWAWTPVCAEDAAATTDAPPARPATDAAEAPAGQSDLDDAIEAKLSARTLDDYGRVLELCKKAIDKGLDEQGRKFASDLYTGTLVDRAGMLVDVIYETAGRDAQWPRMRAFAMRDLEEIVDRDPELGQAHLMIARLEALPQGNRDRAGKAARKALDLLGDDQLQKARAHVVLAGIADDEADRGGHFDTAVELAPRDAEIRRARGLFLLDAGDVEKAREDLEVAVAEDPADAMLHGALGMACAMGKKLEEARQAFDRAIELAPQAPAMLLQRARLSVVEGKLAEARADLDRAVEIAPDDAGGRLLRARVRLQDDDERGAVADVEAVLRKDPDNPGGLELRAMLAAGRRDFAAAIRDFRRLAARRPDDPTVFGQLGMMYVLADQPRKAIERFTRALELDEEDFASRRGRSDAEISIGDHAAAIADLEAALALKPDDSGVLNNLAWLLATSPDDDIRDGARAVELARKACEATEWRQAHIVSTLAAGYAEQGDFENARKYSRQACETGGVADDVMEQLESELASYEEGKPWRERQEVEDATLDEPVAGPSGDAAAGEAGADEPVAEGADAGPRPPRRPFDEE